MNVMYQGGDQGRPGVSHSVDDPLIRSANLGALPQALPQQHAFPHGSSPRSCLGHLRSGKFVFQSITVWLQPQDGHCSDSFLSIRGFRLLQNSCFLLFLRWQLCQHPGHTGWLNFEQVWAVAVVMRPDQALADAGHHAECRGTC